MRHPSTRQLFEYWNARRGLRMAPERSDIDPGAIRRALADTFILTFDDRIGHPFRIAGTRVCAAFGRELKSEGFIELWQRRDRTLVGDLLAVVALDSIGVIAGARAHSPDGELDFELLVLPLKHRGRTDSRLLGALAPAETPYWFGTNALSPLSLGVHRFLRGGRSTEPSRGVAFTSPRGRLVHGFVVYDGGRS